MEIDESYIGGLERNKHASKRDPSVRGRSVKTKTPVVSLVQRDGDVRTFPMKQVTGANLKEVISQQVDSSARIMTDEFKAYRSLSKEFASHEAVSHGRGEYVRGDVHVNTAEGYFSLLKRGITGVYHRVSETHLHRYTAEFDFRYNERKAEDGDRTIEAIRGVEGKRLIYQ